MKLFNSSFQKALVLGVMSGMRTAAGLSFIRSLVNNGQAQGTLLNFLQKKQVGAGSLLLGMTELIVDKLPVAPNRIAKGGPVVRAAAGAICGAAIYQADGKKAVAGALIGSLAAYASTYMFYHLRKTVCEKTGIKDPFIGAAEDALAIAAGFACEKCQVNALKPPLAL